jgi:YesN/AraC family two-component response regulator
MYLKGLKSLIEIIDAEFRHLSIEASGLWMNAAWNRDAESFRVFEIYLFTEGRAGITVEGKDLEMKPRTLLFMNEDQSNRCQQGLFKAYYISFSTPGKELRRRIKSCFAFLAKETVQNIEMEDTFVKSCLEASYSRPFQKEMARSFLVASLVQLHRSLTLDSSEHRFPFNPGKEQLVQDILDLLHERYRTRIRLEELGKRFSINPRYMNVLFKSVTGETILQYLIGLRIEKAKHLLRFTDMSVTDIALETGFADCQHFCKSFKRVSGFTPLLFKESNLRQAGTIDGRQSIG